MCEKRLGSWERLFMATAAGDLRDVMSSRLVHTLSFVLLQSLPPHTWDEQLETVDQHAHACSCTTRPASTDSMMQRYIMTPASIHEPASSRGVHEHLLVSTPKLSIALLTCEPIRQRYAE